MDLEPSEREGRILYLYPDEELDKPPELWKRLGHCTRCGQCCEVSHGIRYTRSGEKLDGDSQRYDDSTPEPWLKGEPIVAEDWDGHWVHWQRIPCEDKDRQACGKYQGDSVCGVFPDLPEICRKWPIMPSELTEYPDCGFWFERLED